MTKTNSLKSHHISVSHYWNIGILSVRKIHRATKIPLSTISYQLKKLKTQGCLQYRASNGRKRKIDAKCSQALGQFIRRNNGVTLHELAEKLRNQCQSTVSTSTISRHLKRLQYENCLPLKTPMLTPEHKKRRVEWAKAHLNNNWKSTIFTDECSFQLFRNTIRRWSKQTKEEKKRIPKNRQKVHVWGSISYCGTRATFNARTNARAISNAKQKFNNKWRLQQDNDPKHRCPKTQKWLAANVPHVMDSSNSPDLNPFANLWNTMKRRIEERKPTNINELKIFINEEWMNIEKGVIINLINSMKNINIVLLVIESKRERIKY
ncbi:unnamed protein product [Didymodactylos carnosus]|uniref:Transposase n=1 Tax=Didymodactylos carnosus TaxID=1234261 RepID=A0A8S2QYI1_9BILA|nr:unnamed protein product [Didymodactylos carnosus]CAF4127591.1 unnamed protein product [Didymodactylos carnosus]